MPKTNEKQITLSFDNGPHPEFTPLVLDILARHDIRTTFFVVGQNVVENRDVVRRARDEGHWIGNHTWSHSLPFRDRGDAAFVSSEIDRTQAAIGDLAHPDKLFRPFGGGGRLDGALNAVAAEYLQRHDFTCVLWNSVPGDFRDASGWPETAMDQISQIDWPLIVLHDIHGDAMTRLDGFLSVLKDKGCVFRQEVPDSTIAILRGQSTDVLGRGVLAN
jgi:peptidoglycan/xylan/chitin deacetylase (PgdA/CDA1 family)